VPSSEPPSNMAGLLVLAAILLIFSCLFSMSESAFLSVNKLRIRFLRRKKVKKAIRVGKLLDKQEELINTILIGNNIVNISISSIITSISLELFGSAGVATATFIVTILLLIFGEIAPKTLGSKFPEKITFALSGFLTFWYYVFRPLVFIFTKISDFARLLTGAKSTKTKKSFTEEDIKTFIEVGEEEGTVEKGEKEMFNKVFKFTDLEAKDIMQPRTKMVCVNIDATYDEIIALSKKTNLSHFPVLKTTIDDICGIIHLKDVMTFFKDPESFSVKSVMKKPLFIPETKEMSSIQEALRESNQSIAIVLDEYSGTAGLLTIDDISSEIFGTLSDEYDYIQAAEIVEKSATSLQLKGNARLVDINEKLKINLESEDNETINGWICEKLGTLPEKGNQLNFGKWIFTVIEVSNNMATKISADAMLMEEEEKE